MEVNILSRKQSKNYKQYNINLGTIIFIIIFIYVFIRIIMSIPKESLSIYEVQNSYIDTNINTTALIVREEKLIKAESSGYVSYYVRDGEKIGKDKTIYTIDETGSIYDKIKDLDTDEMQMSDESLSEVRTRISNFENYFDYSNFSDVYNFRYDIENAVLELTNETVIDKLTSLNSENDSTATYKKILTKESGIVTYYQDGYENFDVHNFKASAVDKSTYKKKTLKTGEIINNGDAVYKLITSENWYLVAPLSEQEVAAVKDKDYVRINIHNSSKNNVCSYELTKKNNQNFIIISMDKQMINYINNRYIDVVILMDQNNGLKIPNTSITKKKVYKLPTTYLSTGSDSAEKKFVNLKKLDEKGEITLKQIEPTIYQSDEQFCYIDPNDFSESDILVRTNSEETLAVSKIPTEELPGVFCVNQGTAKFRFIHIKYQDDDYTIVESDVPYSIAWYDRIVLNQSMVKENQIIK